MSTEESLSRIEKEIKKKQTHMYHIVAVDKNFGIGKDNGLPWPKNKEDMRLFRTLTVGKTVVMGKNTYESLPLKPLTRYPSMGSTRRLPHRTNVVFSDSIIKEKSFVYTLNKFEGTYVCNDLSVFDQYNPLLGSEVFFIGGESIYRQTADLIDMIYLVQFNEEYDCDTFYPTDHIEDMTLVDTIKYDSFSMKIYKR
jgi:dihydrofolate reductase